MTYLFGDQLGSASLAMQGANVISQKRYMPFGDEYSTSGVFPTDFTFTGQRRENQSYVGNLMDYGARMYAPGIGRFISADTIVPGAGNPQSLNRYSYALGNPLKYTDPTGHDPQGQNGNCDYANIGCPDPQSEFYDVEVFEYHYKKLSVYGNKTISYLIASGHQKLVDADHRESVDDYDGAEESRNGATSDFARALASSSNDNEIKLKGILETLIPDIPVVAMNLAGNKGEKGGVTPADSSLWKIARSAYWKWRAKNAAPGEFSESNLDYMRTGRAPRATIIATDKKTGVTKELTVSKELHHINGRNVPDAHGTWNLVEAWPWEHAAVDDNRFVNYIFVEFK